MHKFGTHPRAHVSLYLSVLALALAAAGAIPAEAAALGRSTTAASGAPTLATVAPTLAAVAGSGEETGSLESAASKANETGRKIAMSLIGLGFAIASITLAFRRDFKEAAGVFAVGFVAVLLATPTGVSVLHDTVNTLFGSS